MNYGHLKPSQKTFCVFMVGSREFLLPAEEVREVVDISRIFHKPGAPHYIYGALPVRGKIIPAVDLAEIHSIEKTDSAAIKMVVVREKGMDIGFLCHAEPFYCKFDDDMVFEDLINPKSFFAQYSLER